MRLEDRWIAVMFFAALLSLGAGPAAQTPESNSKRVEEKQHPSFSVKVTGAGRAVIMIPGMSSSGDVWNGTVGHLQSRFACHVLTLAGFVGQPPTTPPLLSKTRIELATYIKSNKLDKPIVIGHSLGGNIALDLAAHNPELVGPLVIVDSLPFYAGVWFHVGSVAEAAPMIERMHSSMVAQSPEEYRQYVRSGVSLKYLVSRPSDLETLMNWGLASDQATVTEAMDELLRLDQRDDLRRITTEVLLLGTWTGLRDQLKPMGLNITKESISAEFDKQYSKLKSLHLALAESARHFIMFDEPEWLYSEIDSFLADPRSAIKDRGMPKSQHEAGNRRLER